MTVSIRTENAEDAETIDSLLKTAFEEPYEAAIVDRLRRSHRLTLSLVAEVDGEVVGHIAFSPVALDNHPSDGFGLAPVAVAEQSRRQGIARRLIDAGLKALTENNAAFVVVLGDPNYYQRFGFQPAAHFRQTSIYDAGDAFMTLPLTAAAGDVPAGRITYDEAFTTE